MIRIDISGLEPLFLPFFLVIGVGIFAFGVHNFFDTREFIAKAQETEGVVVDMVTRHRSHGKTYAPVVEFKPAENAPTVTFTSKRYSRVRYRVGERVPVSYLPDDPANARLGPDVRKWGVTVSFMFVGAALFSVGVLGLFYRRKR